MTGKTTGSPSAPREPIAEHLAALHVGIANGDAAMADALTRVVLSLLPGRVRRVSRGVPHEVVRDSVTDALLDYLKQPHRFDTSHGVPLDRFLQLAAERNVRDWLRKEIRRLARERKSSAERTCPAWTVAPAPSRPPQAAEDLVRALSDNAEWPAARAWLAGERRTSAFAALLRLSHLSNPEQIHEVKRFKDRLKKRIARYLARRV